jgi:hypothetical protein
MFEFTTDTSDTNTKRQLLWQVLGEAPPPLVRGELNGYVKRLDKPTFDALNQSAHPPP